MLFNFQLRDTSDNMINETKAEEIYKDLLRNKKNKKGRISFDLAGISLNIIQTDTVGKSIQEWLKEYLVQNNYTFREPQNTQVFPDFFLSNSIYEDFLEVKSFHYSQTPAFDIANFDAYCAKIENEPYSLYADYLIFGYEMENGIISIEDIWLKKIWEIAGTSKNYPLKTQIKRGMIYNIRPNSDFKKGEEGIFKNEISFLNAIYGTIKLYKNESIANNWKKTFCENYEKHFGKPIKF